MSKPRVDLQFQLESVLGSRHVYFQPPPSIKLVYPCIVYELAKDSNFHADDFKYLGWNKFIVTLIDKDPDSEFYEKLKKIEYCSFDRHFVTDNLHHFVFTIYC